MPKAKTHSERGKLGGRPSIMTEEVMRKILEDIAEGVPKTKAFLSNGVSLTTGYRWAEKDPTFSQLMETAESTFEGNTLKQIGRAESYPGVPDWRAKATLLKMRRPEYRDNAKTEVNVTAQATASSQAVSNEKLEQVRSLRRNYVLGGKPSDN